MPGLLISARGIPSEREILMLSHSDVCVPHSVRCCINDFFPPEILCQIFILAHASNPSTSIFRNPLHYLAQPLVLRSVCKRWKVIAEATRLLWTQFEITPYLACSSLDPNRVEKARAMMQRWLKFACSNLDVTGDTYIYPGLRFTFEAGGVFHDAGVERVILEALTSVSSHWQHVSFRIPLRLSVYLRSIRGRIDHLESLALDGNDSSERASLPNALKSVFKIAPRLTRVSFDGLSGVDLRMPYEKLKRISIKDNDAFDTYHILRRSASSVETVTISPISNMRRLSTHPPIKLPGLTTLKYINNHPRIVGHRGGELFRYLEAPNLHTLILHDCCHRSSYYEAFEMVLRSQTKLKRLELRGIGGNALLDIISLLEVTTGSLEYLLVDGLFGVVFSRPSRMYQQEQQDLQVTTGVIMHLAARIGSRDNGFVELKELDLKLRINCGEVYVGFPCLRTLYEGVLMRNEMGKEGKQVRLCLWVSGSSNGFLKDMRRELKSLSGGLREVAVVIEEA